jgi:hypothetical protein
MLTRHIRCVCEYIKTVVTQLRANLYLQKKKATVLQHSYMFRFHSEHVIRFSKKYFQNNVTNNDFLFVLLGWMMLKL